MSYQVLARKWRPHSFQEMVGQGHVLRALVNALDHQRLHHACLFTGTRGVGKTTLARIIAKCLNCEQGVSSTPCGQCPACREIDEGRFVDLIEVDAASRTKVEDTRELLDNVQYAPTRGRYKVYLIDEVHMLSTHSFNALLKTLEEPPPHVRFLLATTDPQKLPVTILSRCLQFALKSLAPERIVGHLAHVLGVEQIPFDTEALWLLGRAADGSMRDALSLTDQAIAFGEGQVMSTEVRAMLGTLDPYQVYGVLQAVLENDGRAALERVASLAEQGPDWAGVLAEMLNVLHRVAMAQLLPDAVDNSLGDREQVLALARLVPTEDVQFYYQVGLIGRRDLPLAPEPRSGFEMVLLRMLAFRPVDAPVLPRGALTLPDPAGLPASASGPVAAPPVPERSGRAAAPARQEPVPPAGQVSAVPPAGLSPVMASPAAEPPVHSGAVVIPEPVAVEPPIDLPRNLPDEAMIAACPEAGSPSPLLPVAASPAVEPPVHSGAVVAPEPEPVEPPIDLPWDLPDEPVIAPHLEAGPPSPGLAGMEVPPPSDEDYFEADSLGGSRLDDLGLLPEPPVQICSPEPVETRWPPASGLAAEWIALQPRLGLSGLLASIAANCTLVAADQAHWTLQLDPQQAALFNDSQRRRLVEAVQRQHDGPLAVEIQLVRPEQETPAQAAARQRRERQQAAERSIRDNPEVQALMAQFSAVICDGSIEPVEPTDC